MKNISCTLHRCMLLMLLLCSFALGVKAEKYYVIYYEEGATRHYLAISEDGTSLTNETPLSPRCYWVADETLEGALGKNGENKSGTTNNTTNQNNRKTLRSLVYPTKYIYDSGSTQTTAKDGTPRDLELNTSSTARWLLDNENANTPVLYIWYYKHYVYYESSKWRYSSDRSNKSNLVKIESRELLSQPTIYVTQNDDSYQVRISAEEGCNIYYTTDGTTPTTASTLFTTGSFPASKGTTIKAFAVKEGQLSSIAELFLPEILTIELDDREDHSWTYYSGIEPEEDPSNAPDIRGDSYNERYAGKLYSPYPRDVKITYEANGGAVSLSEPENKFVYYKTLEQSNNQYTYTTIDNPFSKRPSNEIIGTDGSSTKQLLGFAGWKVKNISEGTTITDGSTSYTTDEGKNIIPAGQEITFNFTSTYSINSITAEVVLEATWEEAKVTYLSDEVQDDNTNYEFSITKATGATTYENNFLVINKTYSGAITVSSPCTVMMVEPDGSLDYRNSYTFTGAIIPMPGTNGRTKIEFAKWNPTADIDAMGRNFTIGRGVVMDGTEKDAQALYGTKTAGTVRSPLVVNQILKIESGKFLKFENYGATPTEIQKQCVIFGCDYDRANEDNSKLAIAEKMCVAYSTPLPDNLTDNSEICRVYSLSGSFVTEEPVGNAEHTSSYYFNVGGSASAKKGYRYLEILGGDWKNIVGGWGPEHPNDKPAFIFRMKGGHILGSIYGAAQYEAAKGTCTFVITGGTINGWIAGGANGTNSTKGDLDGESFIYVGGNARIDSKGSDTRINRAVGGNVFGAGCGYSATSTSGQVTLGTNVVIADNAYVERGVYGGGSYGYCPTDKTANIYITGGTVDGKAGGVDGTSYNADIPGGVYGGACQNKGGNVNIFMTGGTVNGGLYGGSNASGVLSGNVNITIAGGTVGTQDKTASVFGGGYGRNTSVEDNTDTKEVKEGNVNIKYTGGVLYGNLFGGGNEGAVTGNTNVTITGGEIKQNVYGGGNKAAVSGTTNVVIGQ